MRCIIPLLLAFFVAVVALPIAAAQEDFTASAEQSVSLCPCSGQGYYVTVTNTGAQESAYSLSVNEEVKGWVTISPDTFSLPPNAAGKVPVYITSPCEAQGTIPLTLLVSTSNGLAKALAQQITFVPCYGFSIASGKPVVSKAQGTLAFEPHDAPYEACAKGAITIPLLVKNTDALFDNSYSFAVDDPEASLSVSQFGLKKGDSGVIFLDYAPPSAGTKTLAVQGTASLGGVRATKTLRVAARDCYDIFLDIPRDRAEMCGSIPGREVFQVSNKGIYPENITLSVEGAGWASVDRSSFLLNPLRRTNRTLILNPPQDMDSSAVITVRASLAGNPSVTAQDSLTLTVHPLYECYGAGVDLKEKITVKGEKYISLDIINTGLRPAAFSWNISGLSWASLDAGQASLNPNGQYHATLHLFPPQNLSAGDYPLTLAISSEHSLATRQIVVEYRPEHPAVRAFKQFMHQYRYYLYILAVLLIALFIFRKRVISSSKEAWRQRQIRNVRRQSLEKARQVRMEAAAKRRKKQPVAEEEPEQLTGFRIFSLTLVSAAIVLGILLVVYPTVTINFFKAYWIVAAAVVGLAAIVIFLRRRKGRRRKGYLS